MRMTLSSSITWRTPSIRNLKFTTQTILLTCVWCLALVQAASTQDTPRVQGFGGYSYTHFDSKTFGYSSSSGLNCRLIMVAGHFLHRLGVLPQWSRSGGAGITLCEILFGP